MSKRISKHYYDEIQNWLESISMYISSIIKLEERLNEIVLRNSIVDIAAKVEVHQLLLEKIMDKLHRIQTDLKIHESTLQEDDVFIDDQNLSNEVDTLHVELTDKVKNAEKEFIDVKYYCNSFLTEILK